MHCLDDFATWHQLIKKSRSSQFPTGNCLIAPSNAFPPVQVIGSALGSLSVSQLEWENWKWTHCPRLYVCDNWWKWAARIPQFLLEDNKTNSNCSKPWRSYSFRFLLTNTPRTRDAEVALLTMHDGGQSTPIGNGTLARSRTQNSLTTKSECRFSKSTRLKSWTALKWPTKRLNMCRIWLWLLFVDTECFCGRMANLCRKVFIVTLSGDNNLDYFKSFLTIPPMRRELRDL